MIIVQFCLFLYVLWLQCASVLGQGLLLVSEIELDMVSLLVHYPGLLEYLIPNYTDYNYYKHGAHGPKNNIYRVQHVYIVLSSALQKWMENSQP
jgi:hypothetical protein